MGVCRPHRGDAVTDGEKLWEAESLQPERAQVKGQARQGPRGGFPQMNLTLRLREQEDTRVPKARVRGGSMA